MPVVMFSIERFNACCIHCTVRADIKQFRLFHLTGIYLLRFSAHPSHAERVQTPTSLAVMKLLAYNYTVNAKRRVQLGLG